uniref:Uncharacterized protein n=1 Tax=Tanacetum cinerariifolium TaxID=118510 RepID=A0A6L2NBA6_TANCI|nr:hypothetical protein [Tanacetum cinerariifolium]
MSSSSSDENKKMKSMIRDDDEIKATREKLMLDFHKNVEASFGDKLRSVTYWGSLQMRRVADDKACRCRQLVTSRVGLSPILENPGSHITGSARNIGGRKKLEIRRRIDIMALGIQVQSETLAVAVASEEARALEVVAVARDEANAADPYKVVVLVG